MAQLMLRDYLQTTEDTISSGRIDDAFSNCEYLLAHYPDALEAQRLLGEVYLAQGKLQEAQQTFDWILTNDPENVIVYCDRALISERQSDLDTALDCYQQAYELSRGNSQIRQKFNQLSEKIGQPGFIFSRAGLARLYMRGDLLSQAIQEWETVLALSPERLDARTGLLEAYWREGLFEGVEQVATQLLNDVPGCLKALLLLAHVIHVRDTLRAQQLLQQAEALDPEMVMAQELFSDLMAGQPNDPFFALLKKSSASLTNTSNGQNQRIAPTSDHGTYSTATFSDPLMSWSSVDTIMEPQQEEQAVQEVSPFTEWTKTGNSDVEAWNILDQPHDSPSLEKPSSSASTDNTPMDSWGIFGQHDYPAAPETTTSTSQTRDMTPASDQESSPSTSQSEQSQEEQDTVTDASSLLEADSWYNIQQFAEPTARADAMETPAWLGMLTTNERHQPGESLHLKQPAPVDEIVASSGVAPGETQPAPQTPVLWDENLYTTPASQPPQQEQAENEEELSFFGPEWLKSLGATTIDDDNPHSVETDQATQLEIPEFEESLPTETPYIEQPQAATQEKRPGGADSSRTQVSDEDLSIQAATVASVSASPTASDIPVTLPEHLDVTPADVSPFFSYADTHETAQKTYVETWMEQAAQKLAQPEHNVLKTLEELEKDLHAQGFTPLEPGSLASLAQPGNYGTQSPHNVSSVEPEPLWAATLQPVTRTEPPVRTNAEYSPTPGMDALSHLLAQSAQSQPTSVFQASPEQAYAPASPVPPVQPARSGPSAPTPQSVNHVDAFQDIDLETTMKRPSVRLQPMQQRPLTSQHQSGVKGRSTASNKPAEGNLTYKERLLKGYQYQLAGSYDEAMQEYRIIIRNAPELLDEVISNMRALLKLAPRYAAGYRVLGDAYMRQGEYLQAMEAYNKALTMAKKVK